jgi:hypothetical protein
LSRDYYRKERGQWKFVGTAKEKGVGGWRIKTAVSEDDTDIWQKRSEILQAKD